MKCLEFLSFAPLKPNVTVQLLFDWTSVVSEQIIAHFD